MGIIKYPTEKQPRYARSRAVLVLDKDLQHLKKELEMRRFKVKVLEPGTTLDRLIDILAHRIFVADDPKDFVEAAAIEEFSIIDTKTFPKDSSVLADQISQAFVDLELTSKQPFLLYWKDQREPTLKLID
jgi:hypothetical protein